MFFAMVRDAFEGFVAGVDGQCNVYVHSRGLKVWFDDDTREHYESQLVRVDGQDQLEIGFHAEHPKAPQNDVVLRRTCSMPRRNGGRNWATRPSPATSSVAPVGGGSPSCGPPRTRRSSTKRSMRPRVWRTT